MEEYEEQKTEMLTVTILYDEIGILYKVLAMFYGLRDEFGEPLHYDLKLWRADIIGTSEAGVQVQQDVEASDIVVVSSARGNEDEAMEMLGALDEFMKAEPQPARRLLVIVNKDGKRLITEIS